MNEVIIKYFSVRMLDTLDANQLFRCLFERFGECQITFAPMTPQDTAAASTEVRGIEAVSERFWIFHPAEGGLVRQRDLEATIVRVGQK